MKRTELKRKTPLARTEMKRAASMKRVQVKKTLNAKQKMEHRMFQEAAKAQRVCQVKGCEDPTGPWDPHHVIYIQELRRRRLPFDNVNNVLRLCRAHHSAHHSRASPVKLSVLSPQNLRYAQQVLGDYALDYLKAHYDASDGE